MLSMKHDGDPTLTGCDAKTIEAILKSYARKPWRILKGPARFYHAMICKRNGRSIRHVQLTGGRWALEIY